MYSFTIESFVLAGGKSIRMGKDKAFLPFENKTLLENAVQTVGQISQNRVKIVLNNQSQNDKVANLLPNILCIFDSIKNRGALGGIHAALKNSQSDWTIILACDLPFVKPKVIEKLLENVSTNLSAVVPKQFDGKLQPLCAVYKTAVCLPILEKLFAENESVSAKTLIENLESKIISADNFDSATFLNINTPSDYLLSRTF